MNPPSPRMVELAYLEQCIGNGLHLHAQSQPLSGLIYTEQGAMDVSEALVAFAVGKVIYRFGTWVVTDDGIACLVRHYPLTRTRLREHEDWASHLAEQSWANLWDFVRALVQVKLVGLHKEQELSEDGGSHPS